MAGAEVSLAELGMAGAAFASSPQRMCHWQSVAWRLSTSLHDRSRMSVAGLITAGAEAACAWRSACSNKVETCSSLVCLVRTAHRRCQSPARSSPATWRMSSGAMSFSNPGMADTVASLSSLMSKACRRTRWRKACMSKSFAQVGTHQFLCVPEVPLVGLATRGQHEEQRPYGGFGEPAAVNIRFEPCQLLRQILAVLGRLAGMGSRRCIVVQALSSHGLHQRQAVQRVKRLCVDLVAAITELIQHLFDGGGKLRLQLQERVGLGDGLTMVAHVLRSLMYCGGERMPVRPQFIAHAQRMQRLQPLRTLVRDQGTHHMAARSCGSKPG